MFEHSVLFHQRDVHVDVHRRTGLARRWAIPSRRMPWPACAAPGTFRYGHVSSAHPCMPPRLRKIGILRLP